MADRERSPNYPALDLETAVGLIRRLYNTEGRSVMSYESLAQSLGSTSDNLSGPFRSKIAALRQYGLIEKAGIGSAKLSQLGVSIGLRVPDEPGFAEAVQEAALSPELFRELWARFKEGGSAVNMRNFLVESRGFAKQGAERAVKAFIVTRSFAKLDTESYNLTDESDPATEEATPAPVNIAGTRAPDAPRPAKTEPGQVTYAWLADGIDVQMAFNRRPTAKAITRIMSYLGTMKEDLLDSESVQASDDSGVE